MMETDDRDLVRRTRAGDTKAYGELVRRYQNQIFNAAFRLVNDYDDATDIAQNAFVKVYESLDGFDDSRKFFSWLYRVTINEALNFVERKRRRTTIDEDLPSPDPGPDDLLAYAEGSEWVSRSLMRLSLDSRIVVVMHYFADFNLAEIGELLEIPARTVKSRLHTARERLRGMLSQERVREASHDKTAGRTSA